MTLCTNLHACTHIHTITHINSHTQTCRQSQTMHACTHALPHARTYLALNDVHTSLPSDHSTAPPNALHDYKPWLAFFTRYIFSSKRIAMMHFFASSNAEAGFSRRQSPFKQARTLARPTAQSKALYLLAGLQKKVLCGCYQSLPRRELNKQPRWSDPCFYSGSVGWGGTGGRGGYGGEGRQGAGGRGGGVEESEVEGWGGCGGGEVQQTELPLSINRKIMKVLRILTWNIHLHKYQIKVWTMHCFQFSN